MSGHRHRIDSLLTSSGASLRPGHEPLLDLWTTLSSNRPAPLRFRLLPSRRPSKALCPVFQAALSSSDGSRHHIVTRILDPEHKQPYVSLSPLLLASGRTIVSGLLELDLSKENGDYELHLSGLEPFDEIWSPLPLAVQGARQFGLHHRLATLLDRKGRQAWSLDEGGDAGVVHNWRAPPADLDPALYSTETLLRARIRGITLLSNGEAVRTLVSEQQRHAIVTGAAGGGTHECLDAQKGAERMLRWSLQAYEAYRQVKGARDILQQAKEAGDHSADEAEALVRQAGMLVADLNIEALPPTWQHISDWLAAGCQTLTTSCSLFCAAEQPLPQQQLKEETDPRHAVPCEAEGDTSDSWEHDWWSDGGRCVTVRVEEMLLSVQGKMTMLHRMQLFSARSSKDGVQFCGQDGIRSEGIGGLSSSSSSQHPATQRESSASAPSRQQEESLRSLESFLQRVEASVEKGVATSLAASQASRAACPPSPPTVIPSDAASLTKVRDELQRIHDKLASLSASQLAPARDQLASTPASLAAATSSGAWPPVAMIHLISAPIVVYLVVSLLKALSHYYWTWK